MDNSREQTRDSQVQEKKRVALVSVLAAIFLTGSKLIIGLITGSLGILSEALHSGLDLAAATITYFSVRISDRPADQDHHYGHGKVENVSALAETALLLVTCAWIVYEAIRRLWTGEVHLEVNHWSYLVIVTSIIVDYTRSRALMRAARKHHSQALEADALHFSTDIWSSSAVLVGLIFSQFGWHQADSIAALLVAVIVLSVSYRLGKRAIDVLLDKAPKDATRKIAEIVQQFPDILSFHDIRVRNSGADIFIDLSIHVNPKSTIEEIHLLSEKLEKRIQQTIPRSRVHVHPEPEE